MGICKFKRQSVQDLQTNNQQVIFNTKNEKQASEEDQYLNFDNYFKYKQKQGHNWKAEISNDEKYLAILGERFKRIQIYQLKSKKIIKIIQLENNKILLFERIKFSLNSRYLLFSDYLGYLQCYDINNNFKLIYNQKVHSSNSYDIITIDDDQILTSSSDRSLIITNIKSNQQLLKIQNEQTYGLSSIDFDNSNGFIISCSYESIKFFNRNNGKCQIEQKKAHSKDHFGIKQVQLIQKDNNLISSSLLYLILWQIDYKRLKLNKLKEFENRIVNFTSVLNNNKIVVIKYESILILDKDLVALQSIMHNVFICDQFRTKQLNSLNYLIIPRAHDLLILKKARRLKK